MFDKVILINRRAIFIICTLTLLFALSANNLPATEETDAVSRSLTGLQKRLQSVTSLAFTFNQSTFAGGRERKGSGKALFYRPQANQSETAGSPLPIMRWDYNEPDLQVIINNGKTLSLFTARDKQMIVTPVDTLEQDITYGLLTGSRTLQKDFSATEPNPRFHFGTSDSLHALQLIPAEEQGQVKSVHIWFDNDFLIHRLLIEDHFDSLTELLFTDIVIDKLINSSTQDINKYFQFTPPAGTEIITQ